MKMTRPILLLVTTILFFSIAQGAHGDWTVKLLEDLEDKVLRATLDCPKAVALRTLIQLMENSVNNDDILEEVKRRLVGNLLGQHCPQASLLREVFLRHLSDSDFLELLQGAIKTCKIGQRCPITTETISLTSSSHPGSRYFNICRRM
ncbi:uncharacterized protein LOC143471293 [Clavelina lepadiformis]|uniref:uncharacterized protein LOC143471293 n=1 Tax=Clavelina lepadiformis TaxID=159417 RepID=UPI004041BC11